MGSDMKNKIITRRRSLVTGAAALTAMAALPQDAKAWDYGGGCSQACGALNVKDPQFSGGAKGNGSTDDTAAIQACFNAAFGTTGSPHGTNTTQNSAVYFPAGMYQVRSTLNIKQGLGIHIFGEQMLWVKMLIFPAALILFRQIPRMKDYALYGHALFVTWISLESSFKSAGSG